MIEYHGAEIHTPADTGAEQYRIVRCADGQSFVPAYHRVGTVQAAKAYVDAGYMHPEVAALPPIDTAD